MKRIILTLTLALFTLPILNAQDLPSYVPTEGLVAYYPFNGNANDASGNGNHGTVNGATLANDQNGNDNKAYEFNVNESASWGSPQEEIEIDFSTSMNSNLLTLSAWVNPREKPSPYNDRTHSIFGRWEGGVQNEIFRFVVGNDNALYFQISDGNNNIENYSGGNVPYDSWTHVSAVLNEKNIKLYVNGQKVSDELFVNNINTTGNSDLTIASMPMSNGTWYFFDGHLDEMGYWNRALSEQEIQNLYTSSNGDILLRGIVSAENNQIKNVADPTHAQDAATKGYVDNNVNSFSGSYNDLTDAPTMYTQAQVDALITNLQNQINDLKPLEDVDGNTYEFIKYGDQVWTVENAEMVTYRDGTEIPEVTDGTAWSNLTTGAWCYYDNDSTKGRLYNWYAIMGIHDAASLADATLRKAFAPEGWHVASDAEWTTLENYLIANGYNYDSTTTENKIGKAMASTAGWNSSANTGAPGNDQSLNNGSGFNAFPEGSRRSYDGAFPNESNYAFFWSSTESSADLGWYRYLSFGGSYLYRNDYDCKRSGLSVRFVRD